MYFQTPPLPQAASALAARAAATQEKFSRLLSILSSLSDDSYTLETSELSLLSSNAASIVTDLAERLHDRSAALQRVCELEASDNELQDRLGQLSLQLTKADETMNTCVGEYEARLKEHHDVIAHLTTEKTDLESQLALWKEGKYKELEDNLNALITDRENTLQELREELQKKDTDYQGKKMQQFLRKIP